MRLAAVILAAGQGTRLRSSLPKVLHPLAGRPLIFYSVEAARAATGERPALVIGHGADAVRAAVGNQASYVEQAEQLGTGHAVRQAEAALRGQCDLVLVSYGDMPLLTSATLSALAQAQMNHKGPMTLLAVDSARLTDFGRVVRDAQGRVQAVVEVPQLRPEQKDITERNAGTYCFEAEWLWGALPRLQRSPAGEFYLTDLVAMAAAEGREVGALALQDPDEVIGINTRAQLAEAEAALRRRVNDKWMAAGVTLADPAATYIEPTVELSADTVILPNTHLQGRTRIGTGCTIGPNSIIRDTTIGDGCQVTCSVLEEAELAEDVDVGPFAHLRKGARLERGVHMGNFGEVKNSTLGPGVKMGHFSYVGDATIGADVNVSAGVITCNFDGVKKSKTVLEEGVFLGSDTMLVAPVTLGRGARTGAGSVVTRDIEADTLAVGVPARPIRKLK